MKKKYLRISFKNLSTREKELELLIFKRLPKDLKLNYCMASTNLTTFQKRWKINQYLGTNAHSYQEIVKELEKGVWPGSNSGRSARR